MIIQISSDAEQDLESGWFFYEQQQKGIGDYFWDSLLSDIESLLIYAGVHSKEFGFHRMLAKRFPYAVYYDINDNIISVIAVLPMRRSPVWLKKQINNNI